jgi:hypothetical protein
MEISFFALHNFYPTDQENDNPHLEMTLPQAPDPCQEFRNPLPPVFCDERDNLHPPAAPQAGSYDCQDS